MTDELTIHCDQRPGDALKIAVKPSNGGPRLSVWTVDLTRGADGTVVSLDEARARELFNWLGVWLHTR